MNRINLFRTTTIRNSPSTRNSVAWGKGKLDGNNFTATTGTLIFAALLIVCSLTVGCSSDRPAAVSSKIEPPTAQSTPPLAINSAPTTQAAPVQQTAAKPVHKKIVHKAPATLTYADKTSGVSFQYPRKYALKTGDAANELVASGPVPMDFVQPGGVALAAVALPESTHSESNLASAFFNVSVNKNLTPDQCGEFSVPQPDPASPAEPTVQATAQVATRPISKLMIGDMELQSSETNVGGQTTNGPREETSKYYHVFQNGACYEFALKVATVGSEPSESKTKQVDRDAVFRRLEKILATVKINPVTSTEVTAEVKASVPSSPALETPAQ